MAKKKETRVVVIKRFRDKNDQKTYYEVGQELEFDEARASDVIERGLAELYEPEDNTGKGAREIENQNTDGDGKNIEPK